MSISVTDAVKNTDLATKFEEDIIMAEKLTGGNMELIKEVKEEQLVSKKGRRVDYSNLGFGAPKAKKSKDVSHQRKGFSNIDEAILYKHGNKGNKENRIIEHVTKIMEQPKAQPANEASFSSFFRCYICGFSCSRSNVMLWHNKGHLKTVTNYDSGLKLPNRKKRKPKVSKSKSKKLHPSKHNGRSSHSARTNGHAKASTSQEETKQLLLDWEDEGGDEAAHKERPVNGIDDQEAAVAETNGIDGSSDADDSDMSSDDYPLAHSRRGRQPMPKQVDINSAFDALLESSSLNEHSFNNRRRNQNNSSYVNNDSDSEGSWDKYLDNSDDENDSRNDMQKTNGIGESTFIDDNELSSTASKESSDSSSNNNNIGKEDSGTNSSSSTSKKTNEGEDNSSSSNASGPAYMLVAVDAHGNNVPMPVLNEGGNHLVAVEANMEDGTTRTLYIDPAHLGPNVDLNNLMLHIDNSGQETVIIPPSNNEGVANVTSSLADQTLQDKDTPSSPVTLSAIESKYF